MGLGKLAEVTVIIPARMGSSRLPGKPLADLCGKPMIVRVVESLGGSTELRTAVATDSPEVARAVKDAGHAAVLTGPASSGTQRVYMAWKSMGSPGGRIVNLQGDEPFASQEWVQALASVDTPGVATLASPMDPSGSGDPSKVKAVVGEHGRALYFSRSPVPWGIGPFLCHVGVYCFTPESLRTCAEAGETPLSRRERLEQLAWLEKGVEIRVVTGEWRSMGVDTPDDLQRARRRFCDG